MASVQSWKKPDLEGRPILKMLNDGLHELRLDAGLPSARTIREGIGKDSQGYWIVNHQAVLDTFQQPDLPRLGRLELIVAALSESADRSNTGTEEEVDRFKELWKQAYNELVAQSSVQSPGDAAAQDGPAVDGTEEVGDTDEGQHRGHRSSPRAEEPSGSGQDTARFNYAQESLKGLIINAAQALWDDKDALRVFLGVVRRSEGFVRMADALAERPPANATFYGVESREFEVDFPVAHSELVRLRQLVHKYRTKRKWSFTVMEEQTGVPADDWIRWYTHSELPRREALVAFSSAARLVLDEHVLLLGLWDAASEALEAHNRFEALPDRISFDEAWSRRDAGTSKLWVLAGVGGEEQRAYGADLATGTAPAFTVVGPPRSGRSTALAAIARSLLAAGTRVVLAAPAPSPLRKLADQNGVVTCLTGDDIGHDELVEALSSASPEEPIAVVIDDVEVLDKCEAQKRLKSIVERGFDEGLALVVGLREDKFRLLSSWAGAVRKAHRGLLLSPQDELRAGDEAIGVQTRGTASGRPITPGRGWLHLGDGKLVPVTVPE
ncbi:MULTISPECIES: ATP-binding protein [Streptomyces violaceusniger group]|uniref:ATP-binding protein n=1 Tax=Streptomyces violaceusniger group TaxID=2839105 RepID=UPI000A35E221|nr:MULTISPECIES: ATP-binding protein [Streptomyces violaceusniger group]